MHMFVNASTVSVYLDQELNCSKPHTCVRKIMYCLKYDKFGLTHYHLSGPDIYIYIYLCLCVCVCVCVCCMSIHKYKKWVDIHWQINKLINKARKNNCTWKHKYVNTTHLINIANVRNWNFMLSNVDKYKLWKKGDETRLYSVCILYQCKNNG